MTNDKNLVLVAPLFGGKLALTPDERAADRALVFENRHDPALQALFNLLERSAARLQGEGVQAGAGPHEQGQACGALYLYGLARAWLAQEAAQEPEG